ncbi:hypothetical protein Tco_0638484 [Tanacetum coccineum]
MRCGRMYKRMQGIIKLVGVQANSWSGVEFEIGNLRKVHRRVHVQMVFGLVDSTQDPIKLLAAIGGAKGSIAGRKKRERCQGNDFTRNYQSTMYMINKVKGPRPWYTVLTLDGEMHQLSAIVVDVVSY